MEYNNLKVNSNICAINATWYAAQDLLEKNLTHAKRGIKRISTLKDLGICGYCGGPMGGTYTQKGKVKYRYYVCVDNAKHISPHCPLKRVPATELEDLLLKEIAEILDKPAAVASIMQEAEMLDKNGKHLRATTIKNLKKGFLENWHDQREFFAMNDQQQLVTPPRRRGVRMLKKE